MLMRSTSLSEQLESLDSPATIVCCACGQTYDVGELHICPDDDTSEPLETEPRDEPGWEGGFADNH